MEGKGRAVFATRCFQKGEYVVEYHGDLLQFTDAKKREAEYAQNPATGCYMYYFQYLCKKYWCDISAFPGFPFPQRDFKCCFFFCLFFFGGGVSVQRGCHQRDRTHGPVDKPQQERKLPNQTPRHQRRPAPHPRRLSEHRRGRGAAVRLR